ncbi:MAG TPA: sulfurtransferase TusA family protein [Microlunatus sp.]|nr:sulfurtransferase TusA family protein [Microlunatus sp.]
MSRAAITVDCRGMACPRPIIELARRMDEVASGDCVELLADDPAAEPDLIAWCRMRGQQLVEAAPPRFLVLRRH